MGKTFPSSLLLSFSISLLILLFVSPSFTHGDPDGFGQMAPRSTCHGSTAQCLEGSETNRRVLVTTNFISYQALLKNSVPCSRRGASYYNCLPGAQANPYSRSCSAIARCRS